MEESESRPVGDAKPRLRGRKMKTPWTVHASEFSARWLITIGGIGTIVSVSLVFLYLLWVVYPLFWPPAEVTLSLDTKNVFSERAPLHVRIDEYRQAAWALYSDGSVETILLETGEVIDTQQAVEGEITALSYQHDQNHLALGMADGSLRFGVIGFKPSFVAVEDLPEKIRELTPGEVAPLLKGVVEKTAQGQFRLQTVKVEFDPAVSISEEPIHVVGHYIPTAGQQGLSKPVPKFAAVDAAGRAQFGIVEYEENLLTGESSAVAKQLRDLPLESNEIPLHLALFTSGDNVAVTWADGNLQRFDVRGREKAALAEKTNVLQKGGERLTAVRLHQGRETLLFGDARGNLVGWFRVRNSAGNESTGDGFTLTKVHELPAGTAAVVSIAPSLRSRMAAVGYANGEVRVFDVTTENEVIAIASGLEDLAQAQIAPKDDALLVSGGDRLLRYRFDAKYPEATISSLFFPVWYEGYTQPISMWQSSSGSEGPEMKLGLFPLIFGTLKATFYCMLLGAPLALLAAIYTSEFLQPSVRQYVKPLIEIMASLPSVVLGFLAALVFAPIVERAVPMILCCMVTVPLSYLIGAYLWQLLPNQVNLRMKPYKLIFYFPPLVIGIALGWLIGPTAERLFYAGDMMAWLDGQKGSGAGGWLLLLLPLSALATAVLVSVLVNPFVRSWIHGRVEEGRVPSRFAFALGNFGKFLLGGLFAFGLALAVSYGLSAVGFDPRGTYVDTYVQRNALVVGVVMGFAVIPIIYTIADDALNTVPQHLRSASLGCGATPWQTAVRVVIPTGMSGLFSALMIGLGRAVGETMIVLMAGGNTPVKDWNLFNGFRTLAANIAVELPEAAAGTTHYRTLFLCALSLFVLTFLVNTVAEVVRLRFRRRAYQL